MDGQCPSRWLSRLARAGSVVLVDDFCQPRSTLPFGGSGLPFVEDPVRDDFGQRFSVKEAFEAGVERVVCATEFLAARGVHFSVRKVSVRHGEVPAGLRGFHGRKSLGLSRTCLAEYMFETLQLEWCHHLCLRLFSDVCDVLGNVNGRCGWMSSRLVGGVFRRSVSGCVPCSDVKRSVYRACTARRL